MNKLLVLFLFLFVFLSCQKEQLSTLGQGNESRITPYRLSGDEPVDSTFEVQIEPIGTNKSTSIYSGSKFHDCGTVKINGQLFYTTMIGNQRWTLGNYTGSIDANGEDSSDPHILFRETDDDVLFYYPPSFADTFVDVSGTQNKRTPAGFVANSNWRIPSKDDVTELWDMARGSLSRAETREKIIDGLELTTTNAYLREWSCYGIVNGRRLYHEYLSTVLEGASLFWTSYREEKIWAYAGVSADGVYQMVYGNIDSISVPIRFVQTVKPIFYPEED